MYRKILNAINLIKLLPRIFTFGGGFVATTNKAWRVFLREGWPGVKRRVLFVGGYRRGLWDPQITPDCNLSAVYRNDYTEWVRRYDTLAEPHRISIRQRIEMMASKPLISVVMPSYNPKPIWLIEAIESVRNQIYPHWELCIADDASINGEIHKILERYTIEDSRIKIVYREVNGHISAASNSALELVSGDWVALLDHDDKLAEHALFWVADAINKDPNVQIIYSDEDKITAADKRCEPFFKCDWNLDLFYSYNMISHLGVFRSALLSDIGGFRLGLEGAQDYDLALRCIERIAPIQIYHIPRVLYHWRIHAESTAHDAAKAKPYAMLAGELALNEHFLRRKIDAWVERLNFGYRVHYSLPNKPPLVSLIIASRNGGGG